MSASLDKSQTPPATTNAAFLMPYVKPDGTLVIPFNSDPKFHYWNGGQKIEKTLESLRVLPMADASGTPPQTS